MNSKHRKTLAEIFANPVNGALEWVRIEALLVAVGCQVVESGGSAVMFVKGDRKFRAHRPHPGKDALRYRVIEARGFLEDIGVKP